MRKMRRITGLLLAMLLFISGCAQNEISLAESAEETELEVSWWGTDERHSYTIEGLKEYSTNNPGISIKMTYGEFSGFELKNDVKMFANTAADIMQINYPWLEKYQELGLEFYNLNNLSDILDLSQYDENELAFGTNKNGELIALPIASNVKVVWYNKSVYDKYGLTIPETWDDLYAAAAVMKKDGVYPMDMDSVAAWMSSVAYVEQKTGHQVFDENQSFSLTQEDVQMMVEFYLSLVDAGVVECLGDRSESKLGEGTYAGTMQWISGAKKYEDMIVQGGGEIAVGMPPASNGELRTGWYVKPATLYSISSNTENPQEAAKLLSYMVQGEGMVLRQKLEKGVPCNATAIEILKASGDLDGIQYEATTMFEQKGYAKMSPYLETSAYTKAFENAVNEVLYGVTTLEEAAATAYQTMKEAETKR